MLDGRIAVHQPVRASTDDQVLREALAGILEVVEDESVSVCQPPFGVDPLLAKPPSRHKQRLSSSRP